MVRRWMSGLRVPHLSPRVEDRPDRPVQPVPEARSGEDSEAFEIRRAVLEAATRSPHPQPAVTAIERQILDGKFPEAEQTVRRWLRSGALVGRNFGGRTGYRVAESDLERFLATGRKTKAAA